LGLGLFAATSAGVAKGYNNAAQLFNALVKTDTLFREFGLRGDL